MTAQQRDRLDTVAEELTRSLGIPFVATGNGTISFRDRMRVTDWAVPLMFDGHVARRDDVLVPVDFIGQLLWPALKASKASGHHRSWWYCELSLKTAQAVVDALRNEIEDSWVIGRDVFLENDDAEAAQAFALRVA